MKLFIKVCKFLLLGILSLLAVTLVVALFVKKDYRVQREIVINKPKQEVFEYVKYLKNQHNFSTWEMMDPNMKQTFSGTDGTVGFVSAWDGDPNSVGKGSQEIKKISDGERIDFELHFIKPFESTSPVYMATEAMSETATKLTWAMSGTMNYPMNAMQLFMSMDDAIGKEYAQSLANLKGVLEK